MLGHAWPCFRIFHSFGYVARPQSTTKAALGLGALRPDLDLQDAASPTLRSCRSVSIVCLEVKRLGSWIESAETYKTCSGTVV